MNVKPRHSKLNKELPIALRLTDAERAQAKRLAAKEARSMGGFARLMYLRGLSAHLAAGQSSGAV